MEELWSAVMRKCLQRAEILLDRETAPTADTVNRPINTNGRRETGWQTRT